MTAAPQWSSNAPDKIADDWQVIAARAPRMASTMGRYLTQTSTFLAPRSIDAASIALRQLAFWLLEHTDVTAVADITGRPPIGRYCFGPSSSEPALSPRPAATMTMPIVMELLFPFCMKLASIDLD